MTKGRDRLLRDFGRRLRACRLAAGYETAEDMAGELGIAGPRYRMYERGQNTPPIEILRDLCDRLGQTSDFLLFGRRPPPERRDE